MKTWTSPLLAVFIGLAALSCQDPAEKPSVEPSAYAGQETRPVKAFSKERMEGLLAGQGLGYAKVAELNGYPGPKHVLELATELELSEEQRHQTKAVFDQMSTSAKRLGQRLVDAEKQLDDLFSSGGSVDSSSVIEAMELAGSLEAQLRWTHVSAHLRQTEILNPHQRRRYAELRGYGDGGGEHMHDPDHHHAPGP